jgi:hypothetical protein
MSIVAAELIAYGPASIATDDVSTTGGAIDATRRPVFTQFSSGAKLSLTSDGADARNVTIVGRDATGAVLTETVALNGTSEVLSTNTYERIQSVNAASSSGSRTVTLKQGTGGSTIATIPVNEVGVFMMFQNSFSTGSPQVRYEKLFWKNTNGSLTLTSSTMTLTADPATIMQIGTHTSVDDTATIANRLAVPAGVSFVGLNTAQNIPGGGNLASGSKIGIWIQQTLASNAAAQKNTFTTQLQGNTT